MRWPFDQTPKEFIAALAEGAPPGWTFRCTYSPCRQYTRAYLTREGRGDVPLGDLSDKDRLFYTGLAINWVALRQQRPDLWDDAPLLGAT